MTRVIIAGAKGRMGQSLIACAARFPDIEVTGAIDVGDILEGLIQHSDVVIVFSFHNTTAIMAEGCARRLKGGRVEAYSAGIEPHGMNARAVQVMREVGVDIAVEQLRFGLYVPGVSNDWS